MTDDIDPPEEESEDDEKDELLGFYAEDRHFLPDLNKGIHMLICRSDTSPEQIHHLAKLLLALNRFPRPTKGLSLELTIGLEHANVGKKAIKTSIWMTFHFALAMEHGLLLVHLVKAIVTVKRFWKSKSEDIEKFFIPRLLPIGCG